MNKHKILLIVGLLILAAGVGAIALGFQTAGGEENSLTYEKTVTARITNTRAAESRVGGQDMDGRGHSIGSVDRTYYVEFLVTDGDNSYTEEQAVPKSVYDEYSALEKNTDMEFKLYRNPDGSAYLSLNSVSAAAEEYRDSGQVTGAIALQMLIGLAVAAVGWVLLSRGLDGIKKDKNS
ncbi:MAG: hypothetical protein NC253_05620 [Ruminococcus sp.]|nr:hypothetical protein [Ruminococcus sp.]MCM1380636.1 hypothetical protein [Muribaculaceae bacterium]MCM1478187.1 hypothetical protein [Muribaculaceae bacterium]